MSDAGWSIKVFVPGEPVAKARPRMTRTGHVYTPSKTHHYEYKISLLGLKAMAGKSPLEDSLHIDILVIVSVPKSWSEKRKNEALAHKVYPSGKGDLDNFVKSALDGINGVIFKDDSQVCSLGARKIYGDPPGLYIGVKGMDPLTFPSPSL